MWGRPISHLSAQPEGGGSRPCPQPGIRGFAHPQWRPPRSRHGSLRRSLLRCSSSTRSSSFLVSRSSIRHDIVPLVSVRTHAMDLHRGFEHLDAAFRTLLDVVGVQAVLIHTVDMAMDKLPHVAKTFVDVRYVAA